MPLLELSKVTMRFGGLVAVNELNLAIEPGQLYGLIGPGAAGKSVLLKMITGLLRPDGGTIVVDGEDVTAMPELQLQEFRKRIGMLFQNNALFDHMTVGENIAFPLRRLYSLPEVEIAAYQGLLVVADIAGQPG